MREIKFRAWNRISNHMEFIVTATPNGWDSWGSNSRSDSGGFDTLMQYTGLKDKNGKEIYEGDIVNHRSHWSDNRTKSEVKYDSDCAEFYPFGSSDWALYEDDVEIIGNIYENKDLLNEQDN